VVANWRAAFRKHPKKARHAIQVVIDGRLTLRPQREDDREFYEFDRIGTLEPVLTGVLRPHDLASPTGFAKMWKQKLAGIMKRPPRWSRARLA